MRILESSTLDLKTCSDEEQYWAYNGLDCCITYEVWSALRAKPGGFAYDMSRTMQAPAWSLMNRGIRVDYSQRDTVAEALRARRERSVYLFYRIIQEGLSFQATEKTLTSPAQLKSLFYETLALPVQRKYNKDTKEYSPSVDRASLEKLSTFDSAKHLVDLILAVRDFDKKIQVLEAGIEKGRMHFGYHVAGTMTGRWSSSENVFGGGTNGQNLTDEMRRIFIPDKGKKFCQLDLAQAESKLVAYLSLPYGRQYLDACNSGDLHTSVTKLVWPALFERTNQTDKDIAKQPFYRHFTYRDMSKRGGHACLTVDHEVLTRNGWVSIVEKPAEIMAFNPKTGSSFEQVEHWIDEQHTGKFIEVNDQALSFKVTANHRVLGTTDTALNVYCANSLPKSLRVVKGWGYATPYTQTGPTPELARLLAAFHSDGHQKSTNRCEFHLHKTNKILRLRKLCQALSLSCTIEPNNSKYTVEITFPKDKESSWPDFTWSRAAIEAYIAEYPHWDGHFSETAISIFSTNREFLELFQTFARLIGKGGNIQKSQISGFGSKCYSLQINNRQYGLIKKKVTTEETAQILCPTVPSSFFYIRRNGKISVTGNSNYVGTPATIAMHLKIPLPQAQAFNRAYFKAFPGIPEWHNQTRMRLVSGKPIVTPLGRECHFPGRAWDSDTIKSAVAYVPQSSIGDILNLGFYKIWLKYDSTNVGPTFTHNNEQIPSIQLLTQVHDSVLFQYDPTFEHIIIPLLQHELQIPIQINNETCLIGVDAQIGWNWGKYLEKTLPSGAKVVENEFGLRDYSTKYADNRVYSEPHILDRRACPLY